MNEPNLRILQDNLTGLAFTNHFYMAHWTRPFSDLYGSYECGTSLCIGGLATALELSKTKQSYKPSLDNLSNEVLYNELHQQWCDEDDYNFFIFHASNYLEIPRDNLAPIWHKHVWPTALAELYDAVYHSQIRQKYLSIFPNSPLSGYSIPDSFWKTLAGFLALEAFYEYTSDPKDSEAWVTASAQAIEATLGWPDELHKYKDLPLWLTKYSDRIIHFENIAIQNEPAKQFIRN
jgi:hypothetical protein